MKRLSKSTICLFLIFTVLAVFTFGVSATGGAEVEGYYTFTKYNSKVTIIDVDTSITGNVIVPTTLDGCDVIAIADYAFEDCDKVESITVPECITTIGRGVFKGMDSLESITLPYIGKNISVTDYTGALGYMFDYVTEETIGTTYQGKYYCFIPESLKNVTITQDTAIAANAFYNCANIENVVLSKAASIGNYAFYNCSSLKAIPSSEKLTTIGQYAFANCTAFKTIDIPATVTSIGNYAFNDCSNVTAVNFNDATVGIGDYAFAGLTKLTTLEVSKNAKSIGRGAFYGNNKLVNVTLPYTGNTKSATGYSGVFGYIFDWTSSSSTSGVTYQNQSGYYYYIPTSIKSVTITNDDAIAASAFYNCANLEVINLGPCTSIGSYAFYNCEEITSVTLPENTTAINSYAFAYCDNLESVTLSKNTTSIGDYAFQNSTSLESVDFSTSLKTIGYYAFDGCKALTEIKLPETLTTINQYAFRNCSGITEIVVPDSVTSIGYSAFKGINKLESITLPFVGCSANSTGASENIFGYIFGYTRYDTEGTTLQYSDDYYYYIPRTLRTVTVTKATVIPYNAFYNCSFLTEINIPDTVTSIDINAFYNCSGISEINIPEGIKTISNGAFSGCSNILDINLPSTVTTIGSSAFYGCSKITNITMPEKVTTVGDYAFQNCTSLESVDLSPSLKTIGYYAFDGCKALTEIKLPETLTTINQYAFQNCSGITEIVVPDSVTSIGYSAFKGINKLESITLPFVGCSANSTGASENIFGYIFGYTRYDTEGTTLQYSDDYYYYIPRTLRTVTVTKATVIPYNAFYNCSFLTEINIPDTVSSIGTYAFYNCSGIISLATTENLTSIGSSAFSSCSKLTVFGYRDSYADTYCSTNNVPFVAYEDVVSIAVKQTPTNRQYLGKAIDTTGLILTATLVDGSTVDFNTGYTIDTDKLTVAGENTVKATFAGKETSFVVNASGISSISVAEMPVKTSYYKGQTLDCTGLKLNVKYTDGTTAIVNADYTTNVTTLNKTGNQIVRVYYYTANTLFTVKVNAINVKSLVIATLPEKTDYYVGDIVDTTGLTLDVTYTDGTTATIDSGFSVLTDLNSADITKVAIDYNGVTVSYNVTVTDVVLVAWGMVSEPSKLIYNLGETLDTTGLVIREYYNNDSYRDFTTGFVCTPTEFNEAGEYIITVEYKGSTELFVVEVSEDVHEHSYEASVTKTATCLEDGVLTYSCGCGDSYEEVIESIGHNYKPTVTAPTCTKGGFTTYTCAGCGDSYITDETEMLGHTGGTANCVDKAVCTACGEEYGEIAADNHKTIIIDAAVDATCSKTGLTEGSHCDACSVVITEQIETSKIDHSYEFIVTAPTCTDAGYTTYTCSGCGDNYTTDEVASLGHTGGTANCKDKAVCDTCGEEYGEINADNHKTIIIDKAVEATCSATGLTEGSHCDACGTVIKEQTEEQKLDHSYDAVVTEPTCETAGYTTYTCSGCGDSYVADENINLGHSGGVANCKDKAICETCGEEYGDINADNHKSVITDEAVEATCTAAGLTEGSHCDACGTVIKQQTETPKLYHSYESKVTEATCTEDGYTTFTCAICGHSYISELTDKMGHNFGDWYEVTPATCEKEGLEQRDCSECNYSETQEIPSPDHDFDGSKCENCGYDKSEDCNCNCHTGGIKGFFFKLILFFQKIFKTNKVCKCGKYHY